MGGTGAGGVGAIRLVQVAVPSLIQAGGSASLVCDVDMEDERLYAVKWYKDNEEFFRYVPRDSADFIVYDVRGVVVNVNLSLYLSLSLSLSLRHLPLLLLRSLFPRWAEAKRNGFTKLFFFFFGGGGPRFPPSRVVDYRPFSNRFPRGGIPISRFPFSFLHWDNSWKAQALITDRNTNERMKCVWVRAVASTEEQQWAKRWDRDLRGD